MMSLSSSIRMGLVAALIVIGLYTQAEAQVQYFEGPLSFSGETVEVVGQYQKAEPQKKEKEKASESKESEEDNIEIDLQNGRMISYKPPKVVSDFIDHPTEENALKYLAWVEEKTRKAQKAGKVLAEVIAKINNVNKPDRATNSEGKQLILSFLTPDCQYCVKQAEEINRLLRMGWLNKIEVQGIMHGDEKQRDEFVRNYGLVFPIDLDRGESGRANVSTWPTTIIMKEGKPPIYISGITSAEEIDKSLGGLK